MDLQNIKATWLAYDQKLRDTEILNQQLINSMISERSRSRVADIQRQFAWSIALTLFWLVIIIAVLAGNPFDYQSTIEYVPIFVMALTLVAILILNWQVSTALKKAEINHLALAHSIQKIIEVYHQPAKFIRLTIMVMFSAGLMFPLSFLPRKIAKAGIGAAATDTLIPMAVSLIIYFIAVKLGAFKQKHAEGLQHDMDELAVLKNLNTLLKDN